MKLNEVAIKSADSGATLLFGKVFFDRIADLLSIRKDLGRRLRGKKLFVI